MRRFQIKPYKWSETSRFVVGYSIAGKRHREFFRTKGEAECWVQKTETQIDHEGKSALTVPDELRVMAIKCSADLIPFVRTISEATNFLISHLKQNQTSCPIHDLKTSFIATKEKDGMSPRYLADLKSRLKRFSSDYGERNASTFNSGEVDEWLRNLNLSPVSRNNFRTVLHSMFNFSVDRGFSTVNPITKTTKVKLVDKAPEIYTTDEVKSLLNAATPDI